MTGPERVATPLNAERAATSAVFGRLLAVIVALLEGPKGRVELARAVGTPARHPDAVGRDVDTLRQAGIQVSKTRGHPYSLTPDSVPLLVDPKEANAIMVALAWAQQAKLPESEALASLIARIPVGIRRQCTETGMTTVGENVVAYQQHAATIAALRRAIARHRRVRLHYRKPGGQAEPRSLDVARLLWVEGTLIYQGWCQDLGTERPWEGVRDFRVDRIERVETLATTWSRSELPDFEYQFRLPAARRYLKQDFPSGCVQDQPDGSFVVSSGIQTCWGAPLRLAIWCGSGGTGASRI